MKWTLLGPSPVVLLALVIATAGETCNSSHCVCSEDWAVCHGLSTLSQVPRSPSIRQLQLLHGQLSVLNVQQLPALHSLVVHNCSVEHITGDWLDNMHSLRHLSLSHNRLKKFTLYSLDGLTSLRTLNLSHNLLQSLENYPPVSEHIRTLDLSGNNWNCTVHTMTWLLYWQRRPSTRLAGGNDTLCREWRSQYRTMDGRRLTDVMQLTEIMLERCPSQPPFSCTCDLVQVENAKTGGRLTPVIVEVHCDNRGLVQYPPHLPSNTTTLYLRNNSLTEFGPVIGNRTDYRTLTGLYLDGNLISAESANLLEGSDFIHRFSILSLTHNRLQTIPLYAFDNAFKKRSFNVDSLLLGGNPWLCDCDSGFTFTFQTWLVSHHKLIRDQNQVRCGAGPLARAEPPGATVLSLSREKLCRDIEVNWWDIVNGVLVTLLVLLLLKFVYDVIIYRRTGNLPFVAKKFPC